MAGTNADSSAQGLSFRYIRISSTLESCKKCVSCARDRNDAVQRHQTYLVPRRGVKLPYRGKAWNGDSQLLFTNTVLFDMVYVLLNTQRFGYPGNSPHQHKNDDIDSRFLKQMLPCGTPLGIKHIFAPSTHPWHRAHG